MKAILEYGQFSAMIHLPGNEPQYMVKIMKPNKELSFVPIDEEFGATVTENTRLEFKLKDKLSKDIWLYEFIGEA